MSTPHEKLVVKDNLMKFDIIPSHIFPTTAPQSWPKIIGMGVILIPTLTLSQFKVEQFEVIFHVMT